MTNDVIEILLFFNFFSEKIKKNNLIHLWSTHWRSTIIIAKKTKQMNVMSDLVFEYLIPKLFKTWL